MRAKSRVRRDMEERFSTGFFGRVHSIQVAQAESLLILVDIASHLQGSADACD